MGLNGGSCPKFKCAHYQSGVEAYLSLLEDGSRARVYTKNLKKLGLSLDLDLADDLKEMFKKANLKLDFGIVIISMGEKREEAKIVSFLSYNRDDRKPNSPPPTEQQLKTSASGLNDYNEAFEELVKSGDITAHYCNS